MYGAGCYAMPGVVTDACPSSVQCCDRMSERYSVGYLVRVGGSFCFLHEGLVRDRDRTQFQIQSVVGV